MNMMLALAERIRRGEPISAPLAAALRAASLVQRAGMWMRLHRRRIRVPAYVVSFGNLSVGGVGKTPAVIRRAEQECAAGKRVAVLTRGYGATAEKEPLILAPGADAADVVARFGDEAALIARRVPQAWIVRAANRVAGARAAIERGCNMLILDDGFQAVNLDRQENVLLIDATNPFGNGSILPRGILREPLTAMARASLVMLTRCDQAVERLPELENKIEQYAPGMPIKKTMHKPTHIWRVCDNRFESLDVLRDMPIRVVSAIGSPESFVKTLKTLGANIIDTHALPDHAQIPETLLETDTSVVLTEKDAVRLPGRPPPHVFALAVSLEPWGTI